MRSKLGFLLGAIGKEEERHGFGFGLAGEDRVMAGRMVAKDDLGSGRDLQPDGVGSDWNSAIMPCSDGSSRAPHVRPPRAGWDRS